MVKKIHKSHIITPFSTYYLCAWRVLVCDN